MAFFLTVSLCGYGQSKSTQPKISGRVEAAKTHSYLPYATVQIKGTTIGMATDEAGYYQLVVPREGNGPCKPVTWDSEPKRRKSLSKVVNQ